MGIFKTIIATAILIAVLFFSYIKRKEESEFNPFTLKLNTVNRQVSLKELSKDKITFLYFGFLNCPDACPTTMTKFSAVFKELNPEQLKKLTLVFVDLDPERDSLNKLQEYASYFHPNIIPVTITMSNLNLFTKYFGIAYIKVPLKSKMGYTIDHSTDVIVLSKDGKILEPISHDTPANFVKNRINKLLSEM